MYTYNGNHINDNNNHHDCNDAKPVSIADHSSNRKPFCHADSVAVNLTDGVAHS